MPDGSPSVSVVIAALNAADVIDHQLDALAAQDGAGGFEVLVCDNGSRDDTRARALSHLPDLPRLRVVDASAHAGAGHARNVGAREARGRHLLFCDADDVVSPGWVAAMADALSRGPVVAGPLDATTLNPAWAARARPLPQRDGLQVSHFLPHASAQNLGVHREVFLAVAGFDVRQRHLEDIDLSWRLQLAGHDLGFEPRAVVHVRLRQDVRALWRQGWAYGRAHAELDRRYGLGPPTGSTTAQASAAPASAWQTVRRHGGPLARHPGRGELGAAVWQLGWHVGHRTGHWLRRGRSGGTAPDRSLTGQWP
jgi:glycosyltransferase involved in cell wall biosynthesis